MKMAIAWFASGFFCLHHQMMMAKMKREKENRKDPQRVAVLLVIWKSLAWYWGLEMKSQVKQRLELKEMKEKTLNRKQRYSIPKLIQWKSCFYFCCFWNYLGIQLLAKTLVGQSTFRGHGPILCLFYRTHCSYFSSFLGIEISGFSKDTSEIF